MNLKPLAPLEEYVTPEVEIVKVNIDNCILQNSPGNEDVGGENDPDVPWS